MMAMEVEQGPRPLGAMRAATGSSMQKMRGAHEWLARAPAMHAVFVGGRALATAAYRRLKCCGPDVLFVWLSHRRRVGRFPNLASPVTYNEFILRRCLHPEPRWTTLADKLAVREYVKERFGEKYLVPLIAVPETFTSSVFDALPASFVMKANHGSGFVKIVRDKSQTSYEVLRRLADRWITTNYYCQSRERHYRTIKPRIYFETLLVAADGGVPADVKMNVFGEGPDGPIIHTAVLTDRFGDARGDVYDAKWNRIDVALGHYPRSIGGVPQPENWSEMIDIATRLADGLGHVRVDLYNVAGRIYFGELTFTPGAGVFPFHPDRVDYEWGALLKQMACPPAPGRSVDSQRSAQSETAP
jgi:hypothetical protein